MCYVYTDVQMCSKWIYCTECYVCICRSDKACIQNTIEDIEYTSIPILIGTKVSELFFFLVFCDQQGVKLRSHQEASATILPQKKNSRNTSLKVDFALTFMCIECNECIR